MLPEVQIERVVAAPDAAGLHVVDLEEVLGIEASAGTVQPRVLVCRGSAGPERVGIRVSGMLQEQALEPTALIALPRMLVRLRPARWLAGLARTGTSLALVVDLAQLTDELLRLRPEPSDAAERMK